MSFLKSQAHLGFGVVNFTGGEEYYEIGDQREDGTIYVALHGYIREGDNYITIEMETGNTFHVNHMAVDSIITFKDKDALDDYLLHAELSALTDEAEE